MLSVGCKSLVASRTRYVAVARSKLWLGLISLNFRLPKLTFLLAGVETIRTPRHGCTKSPPQQDVSLTEQPAQLQTAQHNLHLSQHGAQAERAVAYNISASNIPEHTAD